MSFGRNKNLARRAYRPDGSFHRGKRRKNVGTLLTEDRRSVFSLLLKPLKLILSPLRRR